MVLDRDDTLQTSDVDRTTGLAVVSRRRALQVGLVTAVSLAGCLDNESSSDPTDGSSDESDSNGDSDEPEEEATDDDAETEESSDVDNDRLSVVYAFLEAAVEEDLDRMSELSHSHNPLDPAAWAEDGWEFRGGGDEEDLEGLDAEVVDDDATVEDVFELEGAEFWFEEETLTETLDGENVAAAEVTVDDPTEDDTIWMLATEDEEWRYLFAAPVDDTPEDPEEVFEEPIEDENDDVVVEIDWEYDSPTSDIQQAAVVLTDERGVDANRIEIESTIEGASTGAFDRDDDEFTARWEDVTLYIPYDTDGDQIVVTAISEEENESEVVHREHYEP
ncbi:hypothetical protein [Natronorubrum bangense]|uniref:Uncharacterized protein n=2 Tax=Natronorubrum bangense TaxID=61858 RepID=L9W8R1_9EURY|nr:hypothetical protein [Natronorubrum bangense]ELY45646.1 hypothetical protein C494_15393 [Natronorubrum bangense JCM 10635]QCC56507.1 hypothetical protein DV706_18555 [Natronorubrum bangense]